MNGAIHRVNLYPGDSAIGFSNTYPVNSAIQLLNNWVLDSVSSDVSANSHPWCVCSTPANWKCWSTSGQSPKGKKSEILNLELGKVVRSGWKVMRCPKFPSGRTYSDDYGYWKSLYHFKAGAVNIRINFTNYLGFVISMFCQRPSWNRGNRLVCTFGGSSKLGRLKGCNQRQSLSVFWGLSWLSIDI